jgi:hypothetical protein
VARIYLFFGGRSTTAFWIVLTIGTVGLFLNKIGGGEFVALVSTLHAFLIVRSISEDKYCNGEQCPSPADHDADSFDKTEHKGD